MGLIVWNGDNNFFRSTITHNLNGGNIYVEQSKDNPSSTEGARVQAGGNVTILRRPRPAPVTIRMRYTRANGVQHRHRAVPGHGAPASARHRRLGQLPGDRGDLQRPQPDQRRAP